MSLSPIPSFTAPSINAARQGGDLGSFDKGKERQTLMPLAQSVMTYMLRWKPNTKMMTIKLPHSFLTKRWTHGAEIDFGDMGSGGMHTSTSCAAPAHSDNHILIVVPHCASLYNGIIEVFLSMSLICFIFPFQAKSKKHRTWTWTGTKCVHLVQNKIEPGCPFVRTVDSPVCPGSFYYAKISSRFSQDFF